MNKENQIEQMAKDLNGLDELPTDLIGIATLLYEENGWRKQEWISVEDRLPEEREHVIVFGEDGLVGEAWHKKEGLFWWMDDRDGIAAATHWMPLPEPPKMKGGAE